MEEKLLLNCKILILEMNCYNNWSEYVSNCVKIGHIKNIGYALIDCETTLFISAQP